MRRVLVTGAGGRIGRALIPALRESGFEVVAGGRTDAVALDLADPASLRTVVQETRPDAVVNLGGLVGAACAADPALAERVNVTGAVELAAAAREAGASVFVQASSAAVYGTESDTVLDEDAVLGGRGPYAETKRDAELRIGALAGPGFATVSARIFNVWGADFADSLVARLARSTAAAPIDLHGWTRFVRDYIHVDDVATALAGLAAASADSLPLVVNVASGEGVSNEELVAQLTASGFAPAYRVTGDAASWSRAGIARLRALGLAREPISSESSRQRLRALGEERGGAL